MTLHNMEKNEIGYITSGCFSPTYDNYWQIYNANISFTIAEKAFEEVKDAEKQGYKFVHPFDGVHTLQG